MLITSIIEASCEVCNVEEDDFLSRKRITNLNIARGLFMVIASEYGYSSEVIGFAIFRSRPSTTITRQRYKGYLEIKDRYITNTYNKIKEKLNNGHLHS